MVSLPVASLVSIAGSRLTVDMPVVFGVIAVALVLFVAQPVPIDTTAIGIMVALILLEPWTGVTPTEGVSGFSNRATDLDEEFDVSESLTDVVVLPGSPLIGTRVRDVHGDDAYEFEVFRIVRDGQPLATDITDRRLRAGDVLAVRRGSEVMAERGRGGRVTRRCARGSSGGAGRTRTSGSCRPASGSGRYTACRSSCRGFAPPLRRTEPYDPVSRARA